MPALVIITGASSGLGLALARAVPFPARVIDISRSGPPEDSGIEHIEADLSDPESWRQVAVQLGDLAGESYWDRMVLIHNAGTLTPMGFAGEVDSGAYARNVLLNSAAGQVLGDAFLAAVRGREGRHDLIMITSGAASSVYPGWSSYGAGKAALNQWVRNVGAEQQLRGGVRVCAIAPGVLDTDMQGEIRAKSAEEFPKVERFRELHEKGGLVDPAEAAEKLWRVVEGGLEPGSVVDLRDF